MAIWLPRPINRAKADRAEAPVARIEFDHLAHSYRDRPAGDGDFALRPTDHVWEDGVAYALLGPSGCGKTTLLNIISGLLQPTTGKVLFDGRDVTDLPTEERNIAQVFQFPVVYDTMTVRDNLAFPLRNRKVAESIIRARVDEVAEMLGLASCLNQRAGALASDVRQKISMGRGLVRTDVSAILFDEPLTVIDPHLKNSLRRKLEEIHRERALTLIYVTHDQTEALTFADMVVVMHEGEVVQVGTPQELFERPAHTFVGYFVGSPGMNFLPCEVDGSFAVVDGHRIRIADHVPEIAGQSGDQWELGIRPEFLRLIFDKPTCGIEAEITQVEDLGSSRVATVEAGGRTLRVRLTEDQEIRGESGWLVFPPDRSLLYRNSKLVPTSLAGQS
jgi:glycerol transport system ATP-binding protein